MIGLTLVGGIDATRACLLEPADASALLQALDQAIAPTRNGKAIEGERCHRRRSSMSPLIR